MDKVSCTNMFYALFVVGVTGDPQGAEDRFSDYQLFQTVTLLLLSSYCRLLVSFSASDK